MIIKPGDGRQALNPLRLDVMGEPLVDGFGRTHVDLRVSLTDHCNLRCTYCMPPEGVAWLPAPSLLTDEEVVRVIRIAVERLGVTSVRLTGGEPLLRRGLVSLIARLATLEPRPRLSMTTNGIGLAKTATSLAAAGLQRVNVSLDTLHRGTFVALARRDRLADVLSGIDAAIAAELTPVKVNTVLVRDLNDGEAADLLDWARSRGIELRFIEQMPLDAQHGWDREVMVTEAEILTRLRERHQLEPVTTRGSAPAQRYLIDGGPGTVGVIASVTQPFCGSCDRLRLTADGQIRNCLFAREESDLRSLLRGDGSDDDIETAIRTSVAGKRAGHGIDDPTFLQPDRSMSAIGG